MSEGRTPGAWSVCPTCAAVAPNPNLHIQWHELVEQRLTALEPAPEPALEPAPEPAPDDIPTTEEA